MTNFDNAFSKPKPKKPRNNSGGAFGGYSESKGLPKQKKLKGAEKNCAGAFYANRNKRKCK
jgi:hypothetical protein